MKLFFVQIAISVLSPRLVLNSLRHVLEVYRPMSYLTFLFCAKKINFLLGITSSVITHPLYNFGHGMTWPNCNFKMAKLQIQNCNVE